MEKPAGAGGKPVRTSYLVFGSPRIEEPEIQEVVDTIRSGWIGTGPKVKVFEKQFRDFIGCRHACAVNSCTAALHLSMLASGVGVGDEVITTPMTFPATSNAVIHTGATPVFADVDPRTMNIDPDEIEKKITSRTRAIIPVHFAGRPCEMERIMQIADSRDLLVIEDCAHSIESRIDGQATGTFGQLGCFSFYVTKNVITGEGGMVTTGSDELAETVKVMALHGMTKDAWHRFSDQGYKHYQVVEAGFKYNMTDIQASFGIHQLPRVEQYHQRRSQIWRRYDNAFQNLACRTPAPERPENVHAFHLYTLLLDLDRLTIGRDEFLDALDREHIGVGVHYLPVHLHPYYRKRMGYGPGDFPHAEDIGKRTVSLPLSAKLSDQDVDDVIQAVSKILSWYLR